MCIGYCGTFVYRKDNNSYFYMMIYFDDYDRLVSYCIGENELSNSKILFKDKQ